MIEKSREFHKKLQNIPQKEKFEFVGKEFVAPVINFVNNFESTNLPVGLLFSYWGTTFNTKGAFCRYIFKNMKDVNLQHLMWAKDGGIELFSNYTLYELGYGDLLNIRRDMRNRADAYNETDSSDDWGYTNDELNDMYRDAFDGNPEAEWNID